MCNLTRHQWLNPKLQLCGFEFHQIYTFKYLGCNPGLPDTPLFRLPNLTELIISHLVDFLLIKHKGVAYSRSVRLCDIDSSMFYQIQKEIDGLMGFSLLAKCDCDYNLREIKSIGAYLSDFSIKHSNDRLAENEMIYEDFCLFDSIESDSNKNSFIITKINGCLYDLVTGFDILLLILQSTYGLKFSKISKKEEIC